MSSEESESEGEESVLLKKPIPWRSGRVTDFFYDLDKYKDDSKSGQSRRQTRVRALTDLESTRPLPGKRMPSWAVNVVTADN